jgi:hypothetical protein
MVYIPQGNGFFHSDLSQGYVHTLAALAAHFHTAERLIGRYVEAVPVDHAPTRLDQSRQADPLADILREYRR